jgi:hypothetical protein
VHIDKSSGNFEFKKFRMTINERYTDIIDAAKSLKETLKDGYFEEIYGGNEAQHAPNVYFDRQLYQPLFLKDESKSPKYKIVPDSLNNGGKVFN